MANQLKASAQTPIVRLIRPFQEFAARETSGGILLLLCTVTALVWANSPWAQSYSALWHTPLTVGIGGFVLNHDLHFWVNDALMAVFFFVVGLEIKRELLVGCPGHIVNACLRARLGVKHTGQPRGDPRGSAWNVTK